ncbi:hypothetical protein JW933_03450 [candidate division FCPU426 bacterium]|nr:hypothetical protein [candidate division FCPU426 bacterium]
MKPLLNKVTLESLKHRLDAATRLLLFIDYESVLVPPAASGAPIALGNEERDRMRELSERNALTLAIVSSRSLTTIKQLIGFSGIYFIANNGMEISGPDLNVVHGEAKRVRQELVPVVQKLKEGIKILPGVILDNRQYSVGLYISKAKPPVQRRSRLLMEQIWTPVMDSFTLYEARHEMVMRPRVGWGKNRAVMFIWNKFSSPRRRPFVIYLSADESDEDIFAQMGREGMGVIVSGTVKASRSKAGYQLKNRAEVNRFLDWLFQNVSRMQTSSISS